MSAEISKTHFCQIETEFFKLKTFDLVGKFSDN